MIRFLSWGEGSRGWDGEASRDVRGIGGGTARYLEGVGLDPFTLAHYVVVQRSHHGPIKLLPNQRTTICLWSPWQYCRPLPSRLSCLGWPGLRI